MSPTKPLLRINQNLEIASLDEDIYYKTIVQDLSPETFSVAVPISKGRYFLPKEGENIKGRLIIEDSFYNFETTVSGRVRVGNIRLLVLKNPESFFRTQRRNYYRLPVFVEMEYSLLPEDKGALSHKKKTTGFGKGLAADTVSKASTLDIGGGGIKFSAGERLAAGAILKVRLFLEDKQGKQQTIVEAIGRIVRVQHPENRREKYTYSMEFVEIKETVRDKIINFIFASMRGRVC